MQWGRLNEILITIAQHTLMPTQNNSSLLHMKQINFEIDQYLAKIWTNVWWHIIL